MNTLNPLAAILLRLGPQLQEKVADQPAMQLLRSDWHKDILVALRDRLPKVVVVLLLLFIVGRTIGFFVRRMQRLAMHTDRHQRGAQLRTMATIIRATSFSVLGVVAFLQVLNLLNINYGPLLASAGIVGVGIGLGAQSLFKDIINGVFILVEDQYNVGEVVKIAALTGTVEDLTLRLTRLRDGDGTLYIIPNSQVATVSNLSRDFTLATLPVSVDASANPDHVLKVLGAIVTGLWEDPTSKPILLAEPTVLGVDKIDGRSIIYPITLRVRPNQQYALLRELRKRIVITFEQEQIPLGSDSSLLVMQTKAADSTATPAQHPLTSA